LRLLMVSSVVVTSGCINITEPETLLTFVARDKNRNYEPVSAFVVVPFGGSVSDGVITTLSVDLTDVLMADAAAFTLVFPDGFHASSKALTLSVLRDHGDSLGTPSPGNAHPPGWSVKPLKMKWRSADGVIATFHIHMETDQVTKFEICSPIRLPNSGTRALSFIANDGAAVTLPMTYSGITRLFGPELNAGGTGGFFRVQEGCF
jgi:hypothetical protein